MGKLKRLVLLARDEAFKSKMESKHGAIVVKNGRIISRAYNEWGSPTTKQLGTSQYSLEKGSYTYSVHAEVKAISIARFKLGDDLNRADLYIVRYSPSNRGNTECSLTISKPCKYCMSVAKKNGINRVFYSTNTGIHCIKMPNSTEDV